MRAWLVVAVLLSGCVGGDGGGPASGVPGEVSMQPEPAPGNATQVVEVRSSVKVDWSGRTKEGAWVCSDQTGTGQCPAGQQVAPDGAHATTVAYDGNLTLVDVNMTWQADPSQTGLVLAAYGNTSAGLTLLAFVQGASPLNLRIASGDLTDVVPGNALVLMVWPQGKTPTSPSVYVDATRQVFTVEGHLETMDQATT